MTRLRILALSLLTAALACARVDTVAPSPDGSRPTLPPPLPTATARAGSTAIALPPPTPDLAHTPLYWFAPLPNHPDPQLDGTDDFMDLFEPQAEWNQAAESLQVFKLYGGWTAAEALNVQLRQAMQDIQRRGLALALELGPLLATDQCGSGVEGFAGEQGIETVRRVQSLGGRLDLIAFDEPFYYAHFYDGENACGWTVEEAARGAGEFVQQVRQIYPQVVVGDIEPLTGPGTAAAYGEWLETYAAVNGEELAFLHIDVDWSSSTWPENLLAMQAEGRAGGVPIGVIYNGNPQDPDDQTWLAIAGERVKRYELQAGGQPDHVIFQSWNVHPDRALPESDPATWTGFIRTYFEDKAALGFPPGARQANLALARPTRVSRFIQGNEGGLAVDGDPGTVWSAGREPPQWIEIDLGTAADIGRIRLVVSQSPNGASEHRVFGRGPGTDGNYQLLHVFRGTTGDSEALEFSPPTAWSGILILRVETVSSPSWVSWREVEVYGR